MKLRNLAAAAVAATMAFVPTSALASSSNGVLGLVDAITSTGTKLYTSCEPGLDFQGAYVPSERTLVVCGDTATGLPTDFSPEEQNVLRHEAIHLAQDCMDRSFNDKLETTRNLTVLFKLVKAASPYLDFDSIEERYRRAGADDHVILLEFEAWSSAELMTNSEVTEWVRRACRV